ncbi:MAG: response regulator [Deltaproteobacteria bacterium]|nr:response regulator [Deltaproteobacteria bacterium]MBW2139066.1 response regulator [Deltaproteobacteria bacterium]
MPKRVLIVDNDFFYCNFLSQFLEKKGYEVVKAYDGKEGIQKLEEGPIDLLLVEIVLPKMDGRQFIEYLRSKYPDSPFPVIAVSGTIMERLDDLAVIGADYYLVKGPLDKMEYKLNELLKELENPGSSTLINLKNRVIEPCDVFPRREALGLINSLDFERAIFDAIGVGILVVDEDSRVLKVNDFALKILGKNSTEAINRPVVSFFLPEDAPRLIAALRDVAVNRDQRKVSLSFRINSREIFAHVSSFEFKEEMTGWIIALAEAQVGDQPGADKSAGKTQGMSRKDELGLGEEHVQN